jgi:hypothetical protein
MLRKRGCRPLDADRRRLNHPRLTATLTAILATILLSALPAAAPAQDFAFEFGDPDSNEPERLGSAASSVAVDADGNPWVADLANSRIVKYDYDGGFVAQFTSLGDVPIRSPRGIAADDKGFLYVAQGSSEPRIAKIDTGGRLVRTISLVRPGGVPLAPEKIAIDEAGRMYVSDGVDTVHIHSQDGERHGQIRLFAGWGVRDVAVDRGEIFVAFRTNVPDQEGIARYGSDLKLLNRFGPFPDVSFRELAIDPARRINVVDRKHSLVRRFTRGGEMVDQFGRNGIGVGEMNAAEGLAIDCRGNVYALDGAARSSGDGVHRGGSKVLKFQAAAQPPPCEARPLPAGAIDTQINDVEVTQAIQPPFSYTAGPILPPGEVAFDVPERQIRTRAYGSSSSGSTSGEVPLKAALATVVRVYANLNRGPAGGIANVPATLEATLPGGRRLGPIQPVGRPALLRVGGRTVAAPMRAKPVGVYSFALPDEWTRNRAIELTARVNPAGIGCDDQCRNRSTFRLTGISFDVIRVAPIYPIALTDNGRPPVSDPRTVFEPAQRVTPLLLDVHGYQAEAEVGDLLHATRVQVERCFIGIWPCTTSSYSPENPKYREYLQGELIDRLERAADRRGILRCDRIPIGLVSAANPKLPGAMRGELLAGGLLPCGRGYVAIDRPLTTVAHELQHAFGRPHAGRSCPGTGAGDSQEGEPWPPDDRGLLGGIGLNTTLRGSGSRGPYEIVAAGTGGRPAELFDLMSYCAVSGRSAGEAERAAWISPRGWRKLSNWRVNRRSTRSEPSRAEAGERLLRVTAIEAADGELGITGVSPTNVAESEAPSDSPYVLEARNVNRVVLASRRVNAEELEDSSSKIITGTVLAPSGTRQVFLRRGEEIGTVREGSPNPPKLKLTAPRGGTRAASGKLTVRWRASDPDGGPLTATIEYSANGGKSWQGVHVGPNSGRAAVPRSMLTGSKRARVRVRIDDGFSEAFATSKQFTLVAPAPLPRIKQPPSKLSIRADAPLELRGDAIGAAGRPIASRKLRWFDGRRRLGRGPAVSVASLRPGKHRIVLAATQGGRTGRVSVPVRVRAVKPAFLTLGAPARVARRARSLRLRVASTVQAVLRVGGKRFAVSPRARRVKVPIRRGKRRLTLRLKLSAGKLVTRQAVSIPRR